MNVQRRRWLLAMSLRFALPLMLLSATLQGMRAQTDSGKLTLAGAVDLALKQNLDIQIADIEIATRQQERVIARSELLPHASFEADDSVNRHNLRALLGIQIPIPV